MESPTKSINHLKPLSFSLFGIVLLIDLKLFVCNDIKHSIGYTAAESVSMEVSIEVNRGVHPIPLKLIVISEELSIMYDAQSLTI